MTIYLIQLMFSVTLLTTVSLMLCLVMKQRSAASRHAVLAASLIGTLLLPVILLLIPHGHWSIATVPTPESVAFVPPQEPTFVPESPSSTVQWQSETDHSVEIEANRKIDPSMEESGHFSSLRSRLPIQSPIFFQWKTYSKSKEQSHSPLRFSHCAVMKSGNHYHHITT